MSNYTIDYYAFDHSFCELTLYESPPEYVNSYTSLFLSFVGVFGFVMNPQIHDVNLIYSAFVANGLTSFFYHYTNQIGWGLMDRFSMVMIATSCNNVFIKMLEMKKIGYFYNLLRCGNMWITIYLLTVTGLHNEDLFNILFGFFLTSLFILMIFLELYKFKLEIPHKILNYGWKGVLLILCAGIFWLVTEKLCSYHFIIKYLFGHAFWHIGVGLGGYYITLIPLYLYQKNTFSNIKTLLGIPYLENNYPLVM